MNFRVFNDLLLLEFQMKNFIENQKYYQNFSFFGSISFNPRKTISFTSSSSLISSKFYSKSIFYPFNLPKITTPLIILSRHIMTSKLLISSPSRTDLAKSKTYFCITESNTTFELEFASSSCFSESLFFFLPIETIFYKFFSMTLLS